MPYIEPKKNPLLSRKFWLAMIGVAVPVLNKVCGWNLETEQIATLALPIIAYIIGESWVDSKRVK